ncbi:hypothetical protein [Pseudonocardia yunnanensis]|uniref:Lipoprotein n=1 Tax=Pseudonocardia yunnanensis TaxID=58107 RepID=A0ABW4F9T9_9PSEU
MTSRSTALGVLTVSLAAALMAACSAAPAGAPSPAGAPAKDQAAACAAQVSLDSTIPPGLDPESPAPSAGEMQAWASSVEPLFTVVRENAPDTLTGALQTYSAQLDQAKKGQRIDATSTEGTAASNAMNEWVYDSCGFQTLDAVNDGGTVGPIAPTMKPGPLAIRFTNSGDPAKAGFVLLLARVKDGQNVTPADIDSGQAAIEQVTDVAAGALSTGTGPAYSVAVLRPGSYLVSTVLGTPSQFSGTVTKAFTVS